MNEKNKIKRIAAIFCAALVVFAFFISIIGPAVSAAPTQQQLNDAKKKTESAKKDVSKAEEKRKQAVNQYNALDRQIANTEDEIGMIEKQIEQTQKDLQTKEEELKVAEERYQEQKGTFLTRARVMYENSSTGYLEIIFGAESFSDLLSKIEIVSQLMSYDKNILDELGKIKKTIEDAKKEMEDILKRQKESAEALTLKKQTLETSLAEKQKLLNELEKDVEKYKAIYEAAEAAEAQLIRENQSAMSYGANPVKYSGGVMAWPVPSSKRITSEYGYRIHPVYGSKKFHSGIDIAAGYGVDIVAAADGTVTLSADNGGYGKCLIINHGSGISTLYGHNSVLLVSKGQKVTKGQVIAKAGSTGVSTGPHLHFEVRVNGSTTNPIQYLK